MANNDILSEFSSADINLFRKDFVQIIKVGAEIDRIFGGSHHDLDTMLSKYEKLAEQFNKKYKGLKIKTKKTIDEFKARIFVKVKNIREFFAHSASRVQGMKAIGKTDFNQVDVSDVEKFASYVESLRDKIFISYADTERGISTVAAVFDRNNRMIELIYEPVEMMNENSAGFKLCAFYALKLGFDRKVKVYEDASTFGFSDQPDELQRRELYDKFNPGFGE